MGKLVWDAVGEHFYETGVDHGVLYLYNQTNKTYDTGVAWNGLTSVQESPSGAESNASYADNIKYLDLYSAEEFGATIECFTYPEEFERCDGSVQPVDGVNVYQQSRSTFGLSYRSRIGNDVNDDLGYKIHLIYGCKASPSERQYQTVNDSPEALSFSYSITTTSVAVDGYKPTARVTIDSTKFTSTAAAAKLKDLEDILYGTDGTTTYTEFTGESFEEGVTYYERSGSAEPYTYTPTEDQTKQAGKTYYTKTTTEGTTPRLPLPDEVIRVLGANG